MTNAQLDLAECMSALNELEQAHDARGLGLHAIIEKQQAQIEQLVEEKRLQRERIEELEAQAQQRIKLLESKNAQQVLTITALAQSYNRRDQALKASQQCITDFLEVYGRGCLMLVLDEAAKSLRTDALRLVNSCLSKDDGSLYAEGCKP